MGIAELYKQKNYPAILDQYLEKTLAQSYKANKKDIKERIDELVKTTYSCFQCGAYKELLEMLEIIKSISFVTWNGHEADLLFFEFEALLYYLFNPAEYQGDLSTVQNQIDAIIPNMLEAFSRAGIAVSERTQRKITAFNEYKTGIAPYYIISFSYPYAPPFGEGDFCFEKCDPVSSLRIEEIKREQDSFTQFTFKVKGYTNADILWRGHSWKIQERLPVVKKVLPLLNLILLRSLQAMPNRFIPLYNVEQISNITISTYTNDGTPIHETVLGALFDAHWTGGNIPIYKFSAEDYIALGKDIDEHYQCSDFFIQFHQAKNSMNAGLYVESFILFSIAAESMFYYWCGEIARSAVKEQEFRDFSNKKTSSCDECPLFEKAKNGEKRAGEQYPGTNDYMKFLNEVCKISNDDCKALKRAFNKAHKTELRNEIVHGRSNAVSLRDLREAEQSIREMEALFLRIEEKAKHMAEKSF